MTSLLEALAWIVAFAAALPSGVFFLECVLGSIVPLRKRATSDRPRPRTAVLVPAHNESHGVTPTLQGLVAQLGPKDRVVVVADNCTDDTAEVAARSGVTVIQRHDT